jgi:hypothetical protein
MGKKPKVHYFRVFRCKCFILSKCSRFALKVDVGFLMGYATIKHANHVFNTTIKFVEVATGVNFDESNDS